ncbi:hypothetical protein KIN20_026522 [Parelaphostrongylus tenuis]|uniref:Serpin domain-containing protein n=1 Tax=Parelaphostrongylus tenuis TaxID=148309 RepID=A0AAD5QY66_PARTN|nr:hypothetical protein KIN20_026522 [Parelaphostrongylus tenuis]
MLHAGARGETKKQIDERIAKGALENNITNYFLNFLNEILNTTDGVRVNLANGFFLDKYFTIKKEYESKIVSKFHAKVEALDFRRAEHTATIIGQFINKTTEGKVHALISADIVKGPLLLQLYLQLIMEGLKGSVSLVTSAIYFTAEWLEEFYKSLNSKAMFHSSEAVSREVEFMSDFKVYRQYAEDDEVEMLSLPYKDASYAFNMILPKKRFGLQSIRSKIDGTRFKICYPS